MFYSDNLGPVLVLVMLSGVALLVLGKPESHSVSCVQTSHTLKLSLLPVELAALIPQPLAAFPHLLPLSQHLSQSHWLLTPLALW